MRSTTGIVNRHTYTAHFNGEDNNAGKRADHEQLTEFRCETTPIDTLRLTVIFLCSDLPIFIIDHCSFIDDSKRIQAFSYKRRFQHEGKMIRVIGDDRW